MNSSTVPPDAASISSSAGFSPFYLGQATF